MKHSGSCVCSKHAFTIVGSITHFFLCHCKYCKKDTGAGNAANLFFTSAKLIWSSTDKKLCTTYIIPNSRHQKRFCAICGSPLPVEQEDGGVVVPAGCLDTTISRQPDAHIFGKDMATWELQKDIPIFDSLPR